MRQPQGGKRAKNLPRVEREGRGSYLCEEAGTTAPESDPDNLANLDLDFTGRVILPHTPTHTHTHRGDELANYYLPFLSLSPLSLPFSFSLGIHFSWRFSNMLHIFSLYFLAHFYYLAHFLLVLFGACFIC